MNYQIRQISIFLVQNLLFFVIIEGLASKSLPHYSKRSLANSDYAPHAEIMFENISEPTNKRENNFHPEANAKLKVPFSENKGYYSLQGGRHKTFSSQKLIFKRSILSQTENQGPQMERSLASPENSDTAMNHSIIPSIIISELNFPVNKTFPKKVHKNTIVLDDQNRTVIQTRGNITLSPAKVGNNFILYLSNGNSTDVETIDLSAKMNNTPEIEIPSGDNWYTSPVVYIDLRTILSDSNNTKNSILKMNLNESDNFLDENRYILRHNFKCKIEETGLAIFCRNVSLYSIGEYLPNETVALDLSYSIQVKLLKPLFPHLKKLKMLRLSNNHHRYITRAFMGLENLEMLDLSNNDIMALIKAFTYIPKLKSLNLSNNQFHRLVVVSNAVSHLNNLQNLTLDHNVHVSFIEKNHLYGLRNCNISVFSLFNTTLSFVEMGAFDFMSNLKILEMSVNYLNENSLANITCSLPPSIEILYFKQLVNIKTFPSQAIECLTNTSVKNLFLDENYFNSVPKLPYLPYLRLLYFSNCSITQIESDAFKNLINLEVLCLSGNNLKYLPHESIASAQNLKRLYLDSQNVYSYIPLFINKYAFKNFTHLEELRLSRTGLENLYRNNLYGLINLKVLFLSQTKLYNIADYSFETLESLEILDLRGNGIKLVSNFTFYGLKNLKNLFLTGNIISFYSSIYPFQFTPLLESILLHNNEAVSIPEGMFTDLENLEMITLGNNKLLPWYKEMFHPNTRLKLFDLSRNNINHINKIMMKDLQKVEMYLDLSYNPFNCSQCGMKEFQTFCLNSNITLKLPKPGEYVYSCVYPELLQNENFFDIDLSDFCAYELRMLNALSIILMCSSIVIIILATSFAYTFRWYIRYWFFHFQTNVKGRKGSFQNKEYLYDAFIIYSSADTPWVVGHLIPTLEIQEPRYKLCIHQRDFQVGRQITENILEAIENSRKVILVLTEAFIKSEWCMYELHLAQHKLFRDNRDILILVKLSPIDKTLYTKNVSYIEKTRSCFMWSDSYIRQKLFWDQIRKQLGLPRASKSIEITLDA